MQYLASGSTGMVGFAGLRGDLDLCWLGGNQVAICQEAAEAAGTSEKLRSKAAAYYLWWSLIWFK